MKKRLKAGGHVTLIRRSVTSIGCIVALVCAGQNLVSLLPAVSMAGFPGVNSILTHIQYGFPTPLPGGAGWGLWARLARSDSVATFTVSPLGGSCLWGGD